MGENYSGKYNAANLPLTNHRMSYDHDSSYKYLFSAPEMVRDLIIGFVPDAWLHSLDYKTLERVEGSYITEDFRGRADDIVWMRKPEYRILLPEVDNLQGLRVMLSEQLEVWARQYEARGEVRGEIMALQKLLSKRFGAIPPDVLEKISSASQEQVDSWLDQVLDVGSLDDLFGPTAH